MGIGASRNTKAAEQANREISRQLQKSKKEETSTLKLLLLGTAECGKSTITKQMRILHADGFSNVDTEFQKQLVYTNIVEFMVILLNARRTLQIPFEGTDLEIHETLVRTSQESLVNKNPSTALFAALKLLWADKTIQRCYAQGDHSYIPACAKYFFADLERIAQEDYKPTDQDILFVRTPTTGIVEVQFVINAITWRIFDVGGQRTERRKWIHCFDNVNAMIYIVAISEYDQMLQEDMSTNRLKESMTLFQLVTNSNVFAISTTIVLFLNKIDLFMEKLKTASITKVFTTYKGECDYESCVTYIQQRFEGLVTDEERHVYTHRTCATDTQQVDNVLKSVMDSIKRRNMTDTGVV